MTRFQVIVCVIMSTLIADHSLAQQRRSEWIPPDVIAKLLQQSAPAPSVDRFFIAFVKSGGSMIETRFSPDGASWQGGNFPATATSTTPPSSTRLPFAGVGASADPRGLFYNVIFDQGGQFADAWGLGPAIWDTASTKRDLPATISSAPSAADLGDGMRLIAVRQTGDTVGIHLYDHDVRRIIATIPILDAARNSGVIHRPAIIRRASDGKILVAWATGNNVMVCLSTQSTFGIPIFETVTPVGLSTANNLYALPGSAPALASDDQYFYLAIIQEEVRGTLHIWRVVIYRSQDGRNWTEFDRLANLNVTNQTYVGLASTANGSLLVAAITLIARPPRPAAAAQMCSRTSTTATCTWRTVDPFGGSTAADYKEFALIRAAVP